MYATLRSMVLGLDPAEAGLGATEALPHVFGVVMDTVYPEGAATLAALADGTTSLYLSSGGGTIGGGGHANVAAATHRLVALAESVVDQVPVVEDDGLPPEGSTTIWVLTHAGRHAVTAPEADFGHGRHEFSPLFHAAQDVITEVRRIDEARRG